VSGNGGVRPKMYAPASIQPGSSIAHTDETLYPNDLMSPSYTRPNHNPGSMDLGILADMGWNIASGSSSAMPLTTTFDELPGPGGSAPFDRWIEEQYVLPQTPASTLSPALAPRSSLADFAAGMAAYRNGLGSAERTSSGPGQELLGGRSSPDSLWGRLFSPDDLTCWPDERNSVTAALPQVARATTFEAQRTTSSRGALIDSVFAAGSPNSLSNDLELDLSDLHGGPPRAGFSGRPASDT
jgi:hypothetical protein